LRLPWPYVEVYDRHNTTANVSIIPKDLIDIRAFSVTGSTLIILRRYQLNDNFP